MELSIPAWVVALVIVALLLGLWLVLRSGKALQLQWRDVLKLMVGQTPVDGTQPRTAPLAAFNDSDDVFSEGERMLSAGTFERIAIYAPTGGWERSDPKERWFRSIATALTNEWNSDHQQKRLSTASDEIRGKLKHFVGVYGLPTASPSKDDDARNLYELLDLFPDLDNSLLFILDAATEELPPLGLIVIESQDVSLVALGLARGESRKVDFGVVVPVERHVATEACKWIEDLGKGRNASTRYHPGSFVRTTAALPPSVRSN